MSESDKAAVKSLLYKVGRNSALSKETTIADFWGDWQHRSDDLRPASYNARMSVIYSCGNCGIGLKGGPKEPWPRYCAQGHRNEKPE